MPFIVRSVRLVGSSLLHPRAAIMPIALRAAPAVGKLPGSAPAGIARRGRGARATAAPSRCSVRPPGRTGRHHIGTHLPSLNWYIATAPSLMSPMSSKATLPVTPGKFTFFSSGRYFAGSTESAACIALMIAIVAS